MSAAIAPPPSTGRLPRPFRRYLVGSGISSLGSGVTAVALPLVAVKVLNASTLSIGAIVAAGDIGWLVLGLPAGVWVARWPLRGTQVTMDLLRAAAIASIPVAAWWGWLGLAQVIGVALLVGVANVVFSVSNATMIVSLVAEDQLLGANAATSAVGSITLLTGPGLGGALVGLLGAATALVTDAVSYVLSALLLWSLPRPEPLAPPPAGTRMRDEIAEGLRVLLGHPVLGRMLVLNTVVNVMGGALLALTPILIVRHLHEPAWVLGLVYAGEGAGGLIGSALAPRVVARCGSAGTVRWGVCSGPAGVLLVAGTFAGWGAVLCGLGFALFAGGLITVGTVHSAYRQQVLSRDLLPRMLAIHRVVSWGAAPLGALLGSGLAAAAGLHPALLLIAGVGVASVAVVWTQPTLRRARDLPV